MNVYKIFHNPRCSKSRQTLQLLKDNNCKIEIISYLEIDLKVSLIKNILKKLTLKPRDILRKGEQEYKDNNLKKDNLSEEDLINYMIKYPKLIERPIVEDGEVKIKPIMYLALSYDHRIIDGKEAVSFLKIVKDSLEQPKRLFLNL